MDLHALAVSTLLLTCAGVLFPSALWKILSPARFRGLLRAHRVLPAWSIAPVERVLPAVELVAALCCVVALGPDAGQALVVLRAGAVLIVLLSAGFLCYLTLLVRRHGLGNTTCGCSGANDRLSRGGFGRALLLTVTGLAAFTVNPLAGPGGPLRTLLLCVVVSAVLVSHAMAAMVAHSYSAAEPTGKQDRRRGVVEGAGHVRDQSRRHHPGFPAQQFESVTETDGDQDGSAGGVKGQAGRGGR